ncbi:MAG: murein biosynthesis integral membrane protein MurJ [Planctomycetes bacterium]|nr:murein biosynthesis integral membrane protein MurJ [Planctomycetota bacterium]
MSLVRRAFTVSSWTLASRVLGLVRDRLWAGALGGSMALDAFQAAFALPNMLRELFGEGALAAAFIPRYVQLKERDPAAAERFAGAVFTRLALWLSLVALVLSVAAAAVLWWCSLQLGEGAVKAVWVAAMAIPQIPYLVFICCTALGAGVLNGRRRFWVAAAAPVVLNLVMISTVWMSAEDEAWLMPYGVLLAGMLQLALVLWELRRSGGIPPLTLESSEALRDMGRALVPTLVSSGVYQVNSWLGIMVVLFVVPGAGAVQFLYFANRLLQFPLALIGHGINTAAYPEIARRAGAGWAATGEGLREAARLQAFWLLPAAVGLLVTAEPLVRTIYQTGAFGVEAVERTVAVTSILALVLVPVSLSRLAVRAFNAHREQGTAMRVSLATVVANLALTVVLVLTPLREAGLALATAVTGAAGLAAYAVLLRRRGAGALLPLAGLLRPALGAAAMGVAVWLLLRWWPQPAGAASGHAALRLGAAVALGGGVYLALAGTAWLRHRAACPPAAAATTGAPDDPRGGGD